ncbi:MAG: N-acetylglucosamine-6-phosphate deacetylase [Bacteroidales bacterium]|nr:N-acetylglucosamine-6-phosphate deacetylase [Candidatus Cryptobacteroides aphodequi]
MVKTLIKNGRVITPDGILENGMVFIEDGIIKKVATKLEAGDAEVIDAAGRYVCPGFIDIHTHGAGGADFMDGTVEAYCTAARMHAKHGTTLLYPTTLTSTNEALFESFDTYRAAVKANTDGAQLGGMHLEGPYFAPAQAGAQDARYLRCPSPEDYGEIIRRGGDLLKRWSFAPELDGAPEFAAELRKRGILASIGHTAATFEECDAAYKAGAAHMTHFFSCMSTITRRNAMRYAGTVEYGYYQDGMSIEVICDGIHVPEPLLKLVIKIKGIDRIALVTDSMRAAGMPEGPSILGGLKGGQEVIVEDGVAKMPDRSCFAGSVATTDRLVRTMVAKGGVTMAQAVQMMTLNPARFMGVADRKGSLEAGKDADIVIFDEGVNIARTIIKGKTIYTE